MIMFNSRRIVSSRRSLRIIVCLLGSVVLVGCAPPPVVIPTKYAQYKSTDSKQTFRCDYPQEWSADGGGKQNAWVKFASGTALIEARTDFTGSVLGDIAGNGMVDVRDIDPDEEPVAKVHVFSRDTSGANFTSYTESEKNEEFKCSLGRARRSRFTASSLNGQLRGYRATILAHDRRVTVYCSCLKPDWDQLEPVFTKVLESFTH